MTPHYTTCAVASRALSLSVILSLWACSGPQVRTLGNGDGAPAYELRGSDMATIDAEAGRLCTKGYTVLRQSASFGSVPKSDSDAARWLQPVGDWLSGMPGTLAQATIVCRV